MSDLQIMLKRFRWAMLRTRLLEAEAVGAIAGGLIAAAVMVLQSLDWRGFDFLDSIPAWSIPAVLLVAGGMIGCGFAGLRCGSELQAACWLDRRYGLKDRLGTAAELLRAGDHSAEAEFVYAQAVQVGRELPGRLDFWRCTRRRFGVLLLTVLLCGSLLLLPGREDQLAADLLAADAQQRDAILTNLQKQKANASPQVSQWLSELPRVIEVRDEAQLRQLLQRLRQAGYDVREILASDLPPSPSASPDLASRDGAGRTDTERSPQPSPENDATNLSTSRTATTVYHPRYKNVAESSPEQIPQTSIPHGLDEESVSTAWQAARARAAEAESGQFIPLEYRMILRAYTHR